MNVHGSMRLGWLSVVFVIAMAIGFCVLTVASRLAGPVNEITEAVMPAEGYSFDDLLDAIEWVRVKVIQTQYVRMVVASEHTR